MKERMLDVEQVQIGYKLGDFRDIGLKEWTLRHLRHDYHVENFLAVQDVTFSLDKGEMLGIIGSNGAGKSTLLKAVSGIMEPTKGTILRQGTIAALLELASGFDGELTVKENAYLRGAMLGYTRAFMDETYEEIVQFAELKAFEDRPFKQLSSGMQARLAFSIASLVRPDILILDEVLSVGDGAFQEKSAKKMKEIIQGGATTILVSHSLGQVRQLCSKVLWLHKGRQIAYGTDVQGICNAYEAFLANKFALYDNSNWQKHLYSPTMIRKISDQYFIVDCWHHRILYNNNSNLGESLLNWKILTENVRCPHSIDSNGRLYVCDDTDNHRLLVWQKNGEEYCLKQEILLPEVTPHFVMYDNTTDAFYVNGASEGVIIKLTERDDRLIVTQTYHIAEYEDKYFRAFNIIDGNMYLISGPGYICQVDYLHEAFEIVNRYRVPDELCGMNHIAKIGEFYYISAYQNRMGDIFPKLVRVRHLQDLENKKWEDMSGALNVKGVPYFFTADVNDFFLTEIDSYSGIIKFKVKHNQVYDVETLYEREGCDEISSMRKNYKYIGTKCSNEISE